MTDIPFILEKNENVERSSRSLFYGETTVMSTWGSAFGTNISTVLARSTATKKETQQGEGTLFLTNKRLVFVLQPILKAKRVLFSVPLQNLQSVTYTSKGLGLMRGIGLSFTEGGTIQTASFYGFGKESAEDWVQTLTLAAQRIHESN